MVPNEFISVATQLLAGDGEGRLRSAVIRAYYGAFHLARQFIVDCGVVVPIDGLVHRNVRWCLANSAEPPLINAARELDSLRKVRNEADYELASTRFTHHNNARNDVQSAVEIAMLLSPYGTLDERNRVAPKIKAYAAMLGLPIRA